MEHHNDIERIQDAIRTEGGKSISFNEARDLWKRYSDSMCFVWMSVPDDAVRIYCMIEHQMIEREWKLNNRGRGGSRL